LAKRTSSRKPKQVDDYRHDEAKRLNNPPAGLAWQDTEAPRKREFEYDPHLDPQLTWTGKAERTSFEVQAPSIHVHERISAEDVIRSVEHEPPELALFDYAELDRSKAVEFYQHELGWENRMILGDSLVTMTSLLEKERLGGKVQVVYFDPPYGINFNSNFQARVSNRSPKETADDTITREPEQIQAYRDTWKLGVHSYLTYLRDRLLLCRELLAETGSIFVQIGPDNVHRVRALLDEVFGAENACTMIVATTTSGLGASLLPDVHTHLLWYAKDRKQVKFRQLYLEKNIGGDGAGAYTWLRLADGSQRQMTAAERVEPDKLPEGARLFQLAPLTSQGFRDNTTIPYEFEGGTFHPGSNQHWKTTEGGLDRLAQLGRLQAAGNTLRYVRFLDDFEGMPIKNVWTDMGRAGFAEKKRYVVETVPKLIARCLLMVSDPGDLVLDPTCGSGTTPNVAEQYGRRWIAIDTSRVALSLARERILTATYPYYRLNDESQGIDGGLAYRELARITLGSVAKDESPEKIALYDQPLSDNSKVRVSGPFTVEALSRYAVNPMDDGVPPEPDDPQAAESQDHVATLLDALRSQGIPRRGGKPIEITTLEPLAGSGQLQAEGSFLDEAEDERRFAVSLGPRFGSVTVAQIDEALHDAYGYDLIVFAGFAASSEAQDYLAKGKIGRFNVALLEANPDLLVGDLLKSTTSSQTFRLFSAPDVELDRNGDGQLTVEILGVDSFDASTGKIASRDRDDIAAWFLDTDYDGLVFRVSQAFFPRSNAWEAVQRALKGSINPDLMEKLESFVSLPFESGEHGKAAVRVVDDAGTTSEAVLDLDPTPSSE
jgi:adenine-specific DNA-methyltransferase